MRTTAAKSANGHPPAALESSAAAVPPRRKIRNLSKLHPADVASALLGLRRDGVERVAELAALTGISLEDAERLLCLGVAVLAKWGYGEAALCAEYKLTPEQVAQAIRRCPAELLAESV